MSTTDLTQLQAEFDRRIEKVREFSSQMKELKKSFKENFLSWTGGVVGMFARMREDKKMNQFLETPIMNGMTYQQLAEHMGELSASLAEVQKQIQDILPKEDASYYGNVRQIDKVMIECHKSWQNIAPTVANNTFKVPKGQPNTLTDYAMVCIAQPLKALDWPSDLL